MKSLVIIIISILAGLLLLHGPVSAQNDTQTNVSAPVSQPLIREGMMVVDLAKALNVGTPSNEAEAESMLSGAGIAPRNGWIADYPVTPDIVAELRAAVGDAADSKMITLDKNDADNAFNKLVDGYNLPLKAADTVAEAENGPLLEAETYPDTSVINNYYYDQGPPVVTYYAPPPDYTYLYTWVPYPFWWWNVWFPGFFVLADFDIEVHGHGHHHGHHGEFISNHFRDRDNGRVHRIDPAVRHRGGTFTERGGSRWAEPSGRRGSAAIFNRSRGLSPSWRGPVVSPSERRSPVSGTGRGTYQRPDRAYRGGSFNRPAYNTSPSVGNRSYETTPRRYNGSSFGRSFRGTSSFGNRSFSSPSRGFGGRSSVRPSYSTPSMGNRPSQFSSGGSRTSGAPGFGSGFGSSGGERRSFGGGRRR